MKKKSLLIIGLVAVLFVALSVTMFHSSLEYKVMANTEMLKAQLEGEYQTYSKELFENIEVERPWYSLSPSEWTFVVTLSPNSEIVYYKLVDGAFVESQSSNPTIGNPSNETAIETRSAYTYEELSEMPAKELLDLFIQSGLVINDDLKASFTEEELQTLFKENFDLWHTGVSAHSHTMYCDLAEQTKAIYDNIAEPSPLQNELSEVPGGTTHVVDIWDRTKTEQIACDTALEKFWEDETNEYYFECIKSQYIIVMDSTGGTVDVVTALEEGLITIETLDSYGIKYDTRPKS